MRPPDAISQHFRLTPVQKRALLKLGLVTIAELLRHFPVRYERAGASVRVQELVPGTKVTLLGTLSNLKPRKLWKSRRNVTEGWFEDASGKVKVMWFNQPYIASYVSQGSAVKITGTVGGSAERPYIANPEVELLPPGAIAEGIFEKVEPKKEDAENSAFAVYPESRGVTSRWFYHALERVFESGVHKQIKDPIPPKVRARYNLPEMSAALIAMHKPKEESHAQAARKRFAFEEIFAIQVARARERAENNAQRSFPI